MALHSPAQSWCKALRSARRGVKASRGGSASGSAIPSPPFPFSHPLSPPSPQRRGHERSVAGGAEAKAVPSAADTLSFWGEQHPPRSCPPSIPAWELASSTLQAPLLRETRASPGPIVPTTSSSVRMLGHESFASPSPRLPLAQFSPAHPLLGALG